MLKTYEKNAKLKLMTTIIAVMVVAGIVLITDHLKAKNTGSNAAFTPSTTIQTPTSDTSSSTTIATTDSSSSASSASTATPTSSYKDGTYSASSEYYVPHGQESIKVSVTLSSGTISNVSIQNSEGDRDSALFQEDFASSYKQYVVGKKISSLQLSNIAGASDTTQGFMDAISQIASKAQA